MSKKIACSGCDLLIQLPPQVGEHNKLCCPRCQHTITRGHPNALGYALSIVFSSLMALALSYNFVFIAFEVNAQSREISLIQATLVLYDQAYYFLAALVLILTLVCPLLYLLLLLRVLIPLKLGMKGQRLTYVATLIKRLVPWLMVDVFLIGVLVALIKMWSLANLSFGLSFWAYILFVLQFSYLLYLVDQFKLWRWVNDAR
ncbi:MAG: paraquat-inducible protein A [Oceanospirillaceae bacterium]